MRSKWILGIAALAALASSRAPAASWTDSFPPQAVGTYLDTEGRGVMVVPAGEMTTELREAATALEKALRESGRTKLVMNDAALGSTAGLGDEQLLKKCEPFPVEVVAVVRTFPGASGKPPAAVVTLYEKAGKVLTALSAEAGTPVSPRSGTGVATGVSSSTITSINAVQKETQERAQAGQGAQDKYDEQYIDFTDAALVNARTGQLMSIWSIPYQGIHRKPLEGAAFYEKVGRADLAETYRSRGTTRALLYGGGGVAMLGGGALLLNSLLNGPCVRMDSRLGICLERSSAGQVEGYVLMGAGGVAMMIGAFINPHPVAPDEARRLADEHNRKLKKDLGLSAARRAEPPAVAVSVGGWLLPEGGGLTLDVRL